MTTASRTRDQRIADEVLELDAALRCSAHGCPARWSSDFGRKLCTAHAWADPHHWPAVTQEQIDAETERAIRLQYPATKPPRPPMTREQRVAIADRLRGATNAAPSKDWAYALRDREHRGELVSTAQRDAWRRALGPLRALDGDLPL